jgi:4-hydroxybenzoate polyprenyltransferase
MRLAAYLRLGRVSNLPTVWTNVLAGAALAGARPGAAALAALGAIVSIFYTAGMLLNDAFDREIDARERPERPIPAGVVGAAEVFAVGFGMLGAGVWLLSYFGQRASLAGVALAAAIVLYDAWHKGNAFSPIIMGACRALVYAVAALATTGALPAAVLLGAALLWAYIVGLTFVARVKGSWVQPLLAGICVLDAALLALCGRFALAGLALAGALLTRALHRFVPGN